MKLAAAATNPALRKAYIKVAASWTALARDTHDLESLLRSKP